MPDAASQTDIVIAGAARTPMGGFQGELSPMTAPQLGGAAISAALADAGASPDSVNELVMGCVLPAGVGQAPARQAGFAAGLPGSIPASTVNKVCGSGMRTVMMAQDMIRAGSAELVVAGGMESMTNAPYLSPATRGGARLGHQTLQDHMFLDGLEDAYDRGKLMGNFADSLVPTMDDEELDQFEALLLESDPDLYNWYMGKAEPPADNTNPMVARFLAFHYTPEER